MKTTAKITSFLGALALSSASFALDVYLPTDQQVHTLDIVTDEDVTIFRSGATWLQGSIITDGRIAFSGAGEIHLNNGLVIDGLTEEAPSRIDFGGKGNVYINAPIEARDMVVSWPGFGSKLFINANVSAGERLSLTGPFGGTYIGSGVTIESGNTFYSDNYSGEFIMQSGSKIIAPGSVDAIAEAGIKIEGEIITNGGLQLNSRGPNGYVQILRPVIAKGENYSGAYIAGNLVQISAPLALAGNATINANELYNYGNTVSTDAALTINANNAFSYGGLYQGNTVCFNGTHNNYGAAVESVGACE